MEVVSVCTRVILRHTNLRTYSIECRVNSDWENLEKNGSKRSCTNQERVPFISTLSYVGLSFRRPASEGTSLTAAMLVDTIKEKPCSIPYFPEGAEENNDKCQAG
jgi:hypothetical protein